MIFFKLWSIEKQKKALFTDSIFRDGFGWYTKEKLDGYTLEKALHISAVANTDFIVNLECQEFSNLKQKLELINVFFFNCLKFYKENKRQTNFVFLAEFATSLHVFSHPLNCYNDTME